MTSRVGMRARHRVDRRLVLEAAAELRFVEEVDDAGQHAAGERHAAEGDEGDRHVAGEAPDDAPEEPQALGLLAAAVGERGGGDRRRDRRSWGRAPPQ